MVKKEMKPQVWIRPHDSRRSFIGGSDARIIVGSE